MILTATGWAHAAPEPPLPAGLESVALLDARAPLFASFRPTELGDGFGFMDLIGGLSPQATRAVGQVRDALGLYAFSRGELADDGVDPDALVLASWGVTGSGEPSPASARTATTGGPRGARRAGREPGPGAVVRGRFVLKLIDGDRFARAAVAILNGGGASVASFVDSRTGRSLPAWADAREIRALTRRPGLLAVGRHRDGSLIAIRRVEDEGIVDLACPWGDVRAIPQSRAAALLTRMLAPPQQPLSATLALGTRRLLAAKDVSLAVVIQPDTLPTLMRRPSCGRDLGAGEGALVDDVAILARLHPFQWRLELVWSLTPLGHQRLSSAASDDGLLDPARAAAQGMGAAGLLLDGFDAIRTAPRPPILAGSAELAFRALDGCGPAAWAAALARYWPQLAALLVDRVLAPVAAAGSVLPGGLRNVAAVVRQLPDGKQDWTSSTVLFASVPASAEPAVAEMLGRRAGVRPETQSLNGRTPTVYDLSASTALSEAGVERIAGGHVGIALTPQISGLGWYYRLPRRPARLGPQSKIGFVELNIARLLETWAEEAEPATKEAVRLAASHLGQLGGALSVDGDFVRLELELAGFP